MSDTAPDTGHGLVEGHAYEPRDTWWSVCRHCGLAEAAHKVTTRRYCAWCGIHLGEDARDTCGECEAPEAGA